MPAKAAAKSTAKRPRRARGSLSREEILDAAYQLVEHEGLRALSMPVLARHLKAGVTSIYWYFRSKDDLVMALAERVAEDLYGRLPPVGDGPWEDEVVQYFTAFRNELRRAPIYLELFASRPRFVFSRPRVSAIVSRRLEDEVAAFARAGLRAEDAARIYSVCSIFTRGCVLFEHAERVEEAEGDGAVHKDVRDALARLDPDEFPHLRQIEFDRVMSAGDDELFQLGLRLLIEGIRVTVTAAPRGRAGRRRR